MGALGLVHIRSEMPLQGSDVGRLPSDEAVIYTLQYPKGGRKVDFSSFESRGGKIGFHG
jgi:hypothetical protein